MAEENGDKTIASKDKEPQSGDMTENTGTPSEEMSDNSNDPRNLESDIIDEQSTDRLADRTGDAVMEEGEDLRQISNIPAAVIGITSPANKSISSTAVIVGQNHKFPVRSRYRRASTGSCHDFCKYGHKHEVEKKSKKPLLGTIREAKPLKRAVSSDCQAKPVLEKETKNKALVRRVSLPGTIPEKAPPTNTKEPLSLPGSMSEKASSTHTEDVNPPQKYPPNQSKLKRVQSELKPSGLPVPGSSSSRSKIDVPSAKKTDVKSASSQGKPSQVAKESKTKEGGSFSEAEKQKAKEPITSPRTLLKKSPSVKARLYRNIKSFSRTRFHSDSVESKTNSSADMTEKGVYRMEPNGNDTCSEKPIKSSVSSEKSSSTHKASRTGKTKAFNGYQKGTRTGLSSSSPSASTSAASSGQETSKLPRENKQKFASIKTKLIGTLREDSGSKSNSPSGKANSNLKTKAKRTGMSRPEEKDSSSWKVKFRRGTVLNLQVANNSPRKLKFKRGRILGDDQNAKAEPDKSLKSKYDTTNEKPDTESESVKINLRKQEKTEKKDSVDMNNVIEETASKLAKTRKSKVKALVGAFETVMSFRDRKPLVETSAS